MSETTIVAIVTAVLTALPSIIGAIALFYKLKSDNAVADVKRDSLDAKVEQIHAMVSEKS